MPTETEFFRCLAALDDVMGAYSDAQKGLTAPTEYEADLAAFKLMEVVFRHVSVVPVIALIPKPGSHHISARVLLRSAFEIALTAFWLALDDDWKERESR